jgi:uncharacterized membrane protein
MTEKEIIERKIELKRQLIELTEKEIYELHSKLNKMADRLATEKDEPSPSLPPITRD